jgi:glucitol operon activator protein
MQAFAWLFVIGTAWLLQYALTLLQIRHYRRMMRKLVGDYRNSDGYYLFSGVARKALGSGAIVLMVVDDQSTIRNCQVLTGISVFAKFKPFPEYQGMQLGEVLQTSKHVLEQKRHLSSRKQSMARAFRMASENAMHSIANKVATTL